MNKIWITVESYEKNGHLCEGAKLLEKQYVQKIAITGCGDKIYPVYGIEIKNLDDLIELAEERGELLFSVGH